MKNKKIVIFASSLLLSAIMGTQIVSADVESNCTTELHPLGAASGIRDEDFESSDKYITDDKVQADKLPTKVDLSSKMPTPGDQGNQGSCVAFAIAYDIKTMQENAEFKWGLSTKSTQFSPAFLYNQLNEGVDKGLYVKKTLDFVKENGVCTWGQMPYNDSDYTTQPNEWQKRIATNYKIAGYASVSGQKQIKQALNDGYPVLISMAVYPDFDNLNSTNNKIYDKCVDEPPRGYHAVCLVGYDDSLKAYKLINSWGTNWGSNGYGYISYNLFAKDDVAGNAGYVLYDAKQHYTENPLGVVANKTINAYKDVECKQKISMLTTGESSGVKALISAKNGIPPVLQLKNGYYISANKDDTSLLNRYTIVYEPSGGEGSMKNTIVPFGISTQINENTFTKKGYTFAGWYGYRESDKKWLYKNKELGSDGWYESDEKAPAGYVKYLYKDKASVSRTSSKNNDIVHFIAEWTPIKYTVIYKSNGGEGSMANSIYTYGNYAPLRSNTYKKPGYTFTGWYAYRSSDKKTLYINTSTKAEAWYKEGSQPNGYIKRLYADNQSIGKTTSSNDDQVIVTAQWKANKYTVQYDSNGGAGSMSNSTITYDANQKLKKNTFTKSGYTFAGWTAYRKSDGKTIYKNSTGESHWYRPDEVPSGYVKFIYKDEAVVSQTTTSNNDIVTFTAQWKKN